MTVTSYLLYVYRLPTLVTYEDLHAVIKKGAADSFTQRRNTDEVAELMVSEGIFTNESTDLQVFQGLPQFVKEIHCTSRITV